MGTHTEVVGVQMHNVYIQQTLSSYQVSDQANVLVPQQQTRQHEALKICKYGTHTPMYLQLDTVFLFAVQQYS